MVNTTPIPERFWKRVQKTPDCWLWLGAVHETGYGKFWDAFVREWTLATLNTWRFCQESLTLRSTETK